MTFNGKRFNMPFLEAHTRAMPSLRFAATCETPICSTTRRMPTSTRCLG